MGGWNGAVCVASRTMMNTGRSHNQVKNLDSLPIQGKMWGNLMQNAGYTTYMTGKWHINTNPANCFNNVIYERPGMPNQSKQGYNRPLSENDTIWEPWHKKYGGFWKGGKHWSEVLKEDAVNFIDPASIKDEPFFMYLAFNAPHDPRQSPKKFVDMYFWVLNRGYGELQEHFIDAMTEAVKYLGNHPTVVEIDLYNEPTFATIDGFLNLEEKYLTPFYQKAINKLRTINNDIWIFYESTAFGPNQGFKSDLGILSDPRKEDPRLVYYPQLYTLDLDINGEYMEKPKWINLWASSRQKEYKMYNTPMLIW